MSNTEKLLGFDISPDSEIRVCSHIKDVYYTKNMLISLSVSIALNITLFGFMIYIYTHTYDICMTAMNAKCMESCDYYLNNELVNFSSICQHICFFDNLVD